MKQSGYLGALYIDDRGYYCIAYDIHEQSKIVEWHFYDSAFDIICDNFCDREFLTYPQLLEFRRVKKVVRASL